jgi:hypothetical protein
VNGQKYTKTYTSSGFKILISSIIDFIIKKIKKVIISDEVMFWKKL